MKSPARVRPLARAAAAVLLFVSLAAACSRQEAAPGDADTAPRYIRRELVRPPTAAPTVPPAKPPAAPTPAPPQAAGNPPGGPPTPTPAPSPEPPPSASPSLPPSPGAAGPAASPSLPASPTPTATRSPTATPTSTPTPRPSPSPTATPTRTPSPTPSPTPAPRNVPVPIGRSIDVPTYHSVIRWEVLSIIDPYAGTGWVPAGKRTVVIEARATNIGPNPEKLFCGDTCTALVLADGTAWSTPCWDLPRPFEEVNDKYGGYDLLPGRFLEGQICFHVPANARVIGFQPNWIRGGPPLLW